MLPNIKKLRQEKGISQQKLADAIQVSQPSINKYENHDIEPDIEILWRMADFFDTSIDYIVGRQSDRHDVSTAYSNQETELLRSFYRLSAEKQAAVMNMIHLMEK